MLRRCTKPCLGVQSRDRAFAEPLMFAERIGQLGPKSGTLSGPCQVDAEEALATRSRRCQPAYWPSRTRHSSRGRVLAGELDALRGWPDLLEEAGRSRCLIWPATCAPCSPRPKMPAMLWPTPSCGPATSGPGLGVRSGIPCNTKRRGSPSADQDRVRKSRAGARFPQLFFRSGAGELPSEGRRSRTACRQELPSYPGRLSDRQAHLDTCVPVAKPSGSTSLEQLQEAEEEREAEQKRGTASGHRRLEGHPSASKQRWLGRRQRPASRSEAPRQSPRKAPAYAPKLRRRQRPRRRRQEGSSRPKQAQQPTASQRLRRPPEVQGRSRSRSWPTRRRSSSVSPAKHKIKRPVGDWPFSLLGAGEGT